MLTAISSNDLAIALRSDMPPQLVDVRRKFAFDHSGKMVAGASWRNSENIDNWMHELDAARPVVVYCAHGHELSQTCALHLAQTGFVATYLDGGFEQWVASGLPVITTRSQS